jgi:hypothetical protein
MMTLNSRSSTRVLDVHTVDIERVSRVRVCRSLNAGKDDASDDAGSRSTSEDAALPSTAASSTPPASLLGGAPYSISLSGFVVTEWFNVVTAMPHKQKGGKTRNLPPEEVLRVEIEIGEARVEAMSDGSEFTATWSRPDGMRFPVDAHVRVKYRAHNDILETRPLKVSLSDSAFVASQCCVLQ